MIIVQKSLLCGGVTIIFVFHRATIAYADVFWFVAKLHRKCMSEKHSNVGIKFNDVYCRVPELCDTTLSHQRQLNLDPDKH